MKNKIYRLKQEVEEVLMLPTTTCDNCLNEESVSGHWDEAPLEQCQNCGAIDEEGRKEYEEWLNDELLRMSYEEEQYENRVVH